MTFEKRVRKAIRNHKERRSAFGDLVLRKSYEQGRDDAYMSHIDLTEGPFFSSDAKYDHILCYAESVVYALENMKSDEELAEMSEERREYYLGKLDANCEWLKSEFAS